VQPAEGGLK